MTTPSDRGARYAERLATGQRPMSVELAADQKRALVERATTEGRTQAAIIRDAIARYLADPT